MSQNKDIAIEVIFDSTDSTYEVTEINGGHIVCAVFVTRYKQVVCRQIDSFYERTGTEQYVDFLVSETPFNACPYMIWEIFHMIRNTAFY